MTNEIEKQFFETFGIEPKSVKRTLKLAMTGYDESDLPKDLRQFISSQAQVYHVYPQITDRILLELICILRNSYIASGETIDVLKERVLRACIGFQDDLVTTDKTVKQQVQELFTEE